MFVVEILAGDDVSDLVDRGVVERLLLGHGEDLLALDVGEEFTVVVQQFEGVPLAGIVRGGEDDAAVGLAGDDGHLGAGRGAESDVDDVGAAGEQRTLDQIHDQFARQAGVAADDDGEFLARIAACDQARIGGREFHDVERRKVLASGASDGATDSRNGFDKRHVTFGFMGLLQK